MREPLATDPRWQLVCYEKGETLVPDKSIVPTMFGGATFVHYPLVTWHECGDFQDYFVPDNLGAECAEILATMTTV